MIEGTCAGDLNSLKRRLSTLGGLNIFSHIKLYVSTLNVGITGVHSHTQSLHVCLKNKFCWRAFMNKYKTFF
jgi:hypothetical protein